MAISMAAGLACRRARVKDKRGVGCATALFAFTILIMNEQEAVMEREALDEAQVVAWLKANPQRLLQNDDLLMSLTLPEAVAEGNVVDFRQPLLDKLQHSLRDMKARYEGLIVASRDNMSTQSQVHQAVLGLVKSANLEQLLQMITQDLVQLFDVDVVRLAMESPVAEYYEAQYGEHNYSGVSFIDPGMADAVTHCQPGSIRLIPNTQDSQAGEALSQIFADCAGLVRSCALLKLSLPSNQRQVILAFGVRNADRFQPNQGIELLSFLAQVVEYKLDQFLAREGLDVV